MLQRILRHSRPRPSGITGTMTRRRLARAATKVHFPMRHANQEDVIDVFDRLLEATFWAAIALCFAGLIVWLCE